MDVLFPSGGWMHGFQLRENRFLIIWKRKKMGRVYLQRIVRLDFCTLHAIANDE